MIKDPNKRQKHMAKMRKALVASRAAKAARVAADVAEDNEMSVDEIEMAPPSLRAAAAKRSTGEARKGPAVGSEHLQAAKPKAPVSARRTVNRPVTAQRGPLREPMRSATGRVVVTSRSGKLVTRKRVNQGDPFYIEKDMIPDGITYEWKARTVTGQEQRASLAAYAENGWEHVCMSRHPGMYGDVNAIGPIERDGQYLMERPQELTDEAREEDIGLARQLIRTRNEQFTPTLPGAREDPRTHLRAKRSIEGMPTDVGRQPYQIDVEAGLV